MKKSLVTFFLIAASSIYSQAQLQQKVDSLAAQYMQKGYGALVIAIADDSDKKLFYYGETQKGNKQLPDSNSIFELGNLTETFTSILFADMCMKGIVNADDKLKMFLPVNVPSPVYQEIICRPVDEKNQSVLSQHDRSTIQFTPFVCFPDPSAKPQEIMLCDLATHTTGLPMFPYNYNPKSTAVSYTKENLYSFLKNFSFTKPIGYDYRHSYTGIMLLGHALSQKMQMDFDSLLANRLLMPLTLNNTGIQLSSVQQKMLLTGYDINGNPCAHRGYDVTSPALGLKSNAADMLKFLQLNISKQNDYYKNVFDYTHNARILLQGKKNKDKEIALGWKINPVPNNKKVVSQSSAQNGFSAYIGFIETKHCGVVVLSSCVKDVQPMAEEIINFMASENVHK